MRRARSLTSLSTAILAVSTIAVIVATPRAALVQDSSPPASDLPNPYKTVYVWREQAPTVGTKWGYTNGVDVAASGNVMVMTDCGASDCPSEIDAAGKVLKRFGAGAFVEPLGVFVDREGNVWVIDVAAVPREGEKKDPSKGYQVFKYAPSGKLLLTLGTAGLKG